MKEVLEITHVIRGELNGLKMCIDNFTKNPIVLRKFEEEIMVLKKVVSKLEKIVKDNEK